ncbi:hypothetical protein Pcinc_040770 [Petrolisthes cinctipes]|uniref:Uncharacterized protein n=1 Tax=Petrolisthes cinctipes TaxID=88211 RepID=A0AAE1EKH9_PETCI|nr:hypothetical protein Pcinc_040770 [Petrolisthes cinctipes]
MQGENSGSPTHPCWRYINTGEEHLNPSEAVTSGTGKMKGSRPAKNIEHISYERVNQRGSKYVPVNREKKNPKQRRSQTEDGWVKVSGMTISPEEHIAG